jgi:glutamyl-tRNA synthetase
VELVAPLLSGRNSCLEKAMPSLKERAKTIVELAESAEFYVKRPVLDKMKDENIKALGPVLERIADWLHKDIEAAAKGFMAENALKPGDILPGIRLALTGSKSSPGSVWEIMEILGREESLVRLGWNLESGI